MAVIRAVKVRAMADHKFKIGQMAFFRPKLRQANTRANSHPHQITRRLPMLNGEPCYRIKSSEREFAARESELRPMKPFAARY